MTYTLHRQIPPNLKGRDFIVADLHGCLDLFEEKLKLADFDSTRDRVFSVGDLTDRGPDSMGCLRLLRKPWFYAVRGNHEQTLLDYAYPYSSSYDLNKIARLLIQNGGDWVHDLTKSEQGELWDELVPIVNQLPFVMSVGEGAAKFHVAHAELMTRGKGNLEDAWPLNARAKTEAKILTDDQINEENLLEMTEPMVWGRRIFYDFKPSRATSLDTEIGRLLVGKESWHKDLSLTYCGHSIVNSLRINRSHLMIDRGAFLRHKDKNSELSFLEHKNVLASLSALN